MGLFRMAFRTIQAVSPERAATLAERLFFTTPRAMLTRSMQAQLDRARPFAVTLENHRIAAWSWGMGDGPVVYLVHGWGSRGGRLAAYVAPLLAAGFRVVAFDGIGHGASEGRMSSMPELARTLEAVVGAGGPAHGIIAHSLGASAATLAMDWGLEVPRVVFIAPAADPIGFTLRWANQIGMRPDVLERMRASSQRRIAFSWDDLDVLLMARRRTAPLLVVHDANDPVVPWSDGAAIADAWPNSSLITTKGLGHSEVVRAPSVVSQAVEFLSGQSAARGARVSASAWEAHDLERDLFFRARRTLRPGLSA
jgi:pimeloyl-ACP methyl ester carboxylesterase